MKYVAIEVYLITDTFIGLIVSSAETIKTGPITTSFLHYIDINM